MAKRKPRETPLMQQYLGIKSEHPDAILFFRLGDFYEMFFDDAVTVSSALDLTLTSRHKGSEEPIPMAGVPHHAARSYIARLTEQGHKVALCDQVEDAKLTKGLVKREVVRVITPGVVVDDEALDPKRARYLAAIAGGGERWGLAYLDVSTGEFRATELNSLQSLIAEVSRVGPHEILAEAADLAPDKGVLGELLQLYRQSAYTAIEPHTWQQAKGVLESALAGTAAELGLEERAIAARAAADVIVYARATQPAGMLPVSRLQLYDSGQAMVLDDVAIANLELTETLMGGKKAGSLLDVIDASVTAPGARLMRRWLLYPLTEVAPIRRRQDAVAYLVTNASVRARARDELGNVYDLERLSTRVLLGVANPRDLGRLRDSLAHLPALAKSLADSGEGAIELPELLHFDSAVLEKLEILHRLLDRAVVDEPGVMLKDGGYIRSGYSDAVDRQRGLASGGKDAILAIENRERERTGIPSLKVKYNKVFGYYIEVTKSHLDRVPEEYVRKQTIANGERYVIGELAELEANVLSAQEELLVLEQELFAALCDEVKERASLLRDMGLLVATVDVCAALAEVAHTRHYVRPEVSDSGALDIVDGRHPVVETMVPSGRFVPNHCHLEVGDQQILLVTGPNMAGKSTFMRQVAHIVLLAQMGSFVPATEARVGLVDRIFTRVGAADNLARGESTFMVEMRETAAILHGATRRSLLILDEVGRGTSTFDGVSIAWAVTEFIHDAIGARTLFATHYHELCALSNTRPRVHNVSMAVREHNGEIVFLRQVVPGGANRSYGIDVARLAGLPRSVIARGRQILGQLETGGQWHGSSQLSLFAAAPAVPPVTADEAQGASPMIEGARGDGHVTDEPRRDDTATDRAATDRAATNGAATKNGVMSDAASAVIGRLQTLDPHRITPLEALQILSELHDSAANVDEAATSRQ